MIETVLFDLSEVFLNGLKNFEHHFCGPRGMDATTLHKHLQGRKVYDLFERRITEQEYWRQVITEGDYQITPDEFKAGIRSYFTELPQTPDLLRRIAQTGRTKLVLLSDHAEEWIDHIETTHKFMELFHQRVYSFQSGLTKEDTGAFHYAIKASKSDLSTTLFVDDNANNVGVAAASGIAYTHHFTSPAGLEACLVRHGLILPQR